MFGNLNQYLLTHRLGKGYCMANTCCGKEHCSQDTPILNHLTIIDIQILNIFENLSKQSVFYLLSVWENHKFRLENRIEYSMLAQIVDAMAFGKSFYLGASPNQTKSMIFTMKMLELMLFV